MFTVTSYNRCCQTTQDTQIKFYYHLSRLNIVAMLCATVNATAGGPTVAVAQTGIYFGEPFTFGTDTINLIDYSASTLRKSASLTHLPSVLRCDSRSCSASLRYRVANILVLDWSKFVVVCQTEFCWLVSMLRV